MGGVSANPPADAQSVSDLHARVEAERLGRTFLLFRDRDGRQRLFLFAPGAAVASVGRQPPADFLLDWDSQVSRSHARFERAEDAWVLVDDGISSNGTFVNDERVSGARRLNDGDTLRFGTTTVEFHSPSRQGPGAPGAADAPPAVNLSTTQRRILVALCRPSQGQNGVARPATDQEIADELCLSVGEVRAHLGVLYAKLGLQEQPQGERRARLVERAFSAGLISERDL